MNKDELKRATKHLGGLFQGQVTEELAILIRKDWAHFEFKLTLQTIEEHKRTSADNFVHYAKLLGAIRDAHRPSAPSCPSSNLADREGTWFDVFRRQNPQLRGANDHEVALRVYRGWWIRSPQTDHWRAKLSRECAVKLRDAGRTDTNPGWTEAEAAEWAETIFADVDYFRLVLQQLRGGLPMADRHLEASARA